MKKYYKTKPLNITKLKSYLNKKPKTNESSSRQPASRVSK